MKPTRHIWLPLYMLAGLCVSLCLSACEMLPTGASQDTPTIDAVTDTATDVDAETRAALTSEDTPVGALIHRIDLPLDVSLEPCWTAVNEAEVPLLKRGMWQINGLRIGVLHADNAPAFAQGLPDIHGESRAKLIGSPYPSPVRSTPRLIQPVVVDLTDPPKSPTVLRLRGGKLQLLAKITRDETGQPYLELTPHHYKPKADLIPRNPLEKQLDGQVFTELTARLPLTRDTAVVIGLYRPWLEPVDLRQPLAPADTADVPQPVTEPGTGSTPDTEQPTEDAVDEEADTTGDTDGVDDEEDAEPGQPEIPNHLGKALMAGRRAGQDTQVIMVISLIDDWE